MYSYNEFPFCVDQKYQLFYLAIELRERHPEVTPAYHFNKIMIPF